MTSDHYLNSMIIEALLENGIRDINEITIVSQEHLPAIKRIFYDSGFDDKELADSLYEQLLGMICDYFSKILPRDQSKPSS